MLDHFDEHGSCKRLNARNSHNSNDSMSTKRKRSFLSIKDKQILISRLDKGEKGTNLALEFGISKQQISDVRKKKDKILKFTDNIETSEGLKRKSLKLANDKRLDQALYTWFIQQRSTGTPISGPLLQEKAKHFAMRSHFKTLKQTTMLHFFRNDE